MHWHVIFSKGCETLINQTFLVFDEILPFRNVILSCFTVYYDALLYDLSSMSRLIHFFGEFQPVLDQCDWLGTPSLWDKEIRCGFC